MTKLLGLLPNPWVILAFLAFLGGFGWVMHARGQEDGESRATARYEARLEAQREADDLQRQINRGKSADLQKKADEAQRIKDETTRAVDAAVLAIRHELRNRPTRPAAPEPGRSDPVSCPPAGTTGAGLFREDGEFLTGEAARANKLRAALAQCYKRVDEFEAATKSRDSP